MSIVDPRRYRLSGAVRLSVPRCLRRCVGWAVALVGVAVALSGCTPKPSVPIPTSSPPTVWVSAPTPTTARPVSSASSPAPTATPSLYDQAVAVQQAFFEEAAKLQVAGGADALPPEMARLVDGVALSVTTQLFAALKASGSRPVGTPQFRVVWVRPAAGVPAAGTLIALETCESVTGGSWSGGNGPAGQGEDRLFAYHYSFRRVAGGRLVISEFWGEEVESCPA